MESKHQVILAIVLCVTVLQIIAFYMGIDGQMLTLTTNVLIAILSFLTGVNIGSKTTKSE